MFIALLLALLAAAVLHGWKTGPRTKSRFAELIIVYLLVGYCGVVMLGVGVFILVAGERAAAMLGTPPGNLFQQFFGFAYVGMALIATLSIWLRGTYLLAPVLCWSIYFLGATYIHVVDYAAAGYLNVGTFLLIFATHALVPVLLLAMTFLRYRLASQPADADRLAFLG